MAKAGGVLGPFAVGESPDARRRRRLTMPVQVAVLVGCCCPRVLRTGEVEHERRLVRPGSEDLLAALVEHTAPPFKHRLEKGLRRPLKTTHPAAVAFLLAHPFHFEAEGSGLVGPMLDYGARAIELDAHMVGNFVNDNLPKPKGEDVLLGHVGMAAEDAGAHSGVVP